MKSPAPIPPAAPPLEPRPAKSLVAEALARLSLGAVIIALSCLALKQAENLGKICIRTGGKPNFWEGCLYPANPPPRATNRNR